MSPFFYETMPLPTVTLSSLRNLARQYANQELGSMLEADALVTDAEMASILNFGVRELHDLFTRVHGEEYFLRAAEIAVDESKNIWELPTDLASVKGVDYSNTSFGSYEVAPAIPGGGDEPDGSDAFVGQVPVSEKEDSVALLPYSWEDRNRGAEEGYLRGRPDLPRCPARYRIFSQRMIGGQLDGNGDAIEDAGPANFIRLNNALSGFLLVWYIPEVPLLSLATDSIAGFHGFEEYPALVCAKYMLDKEESDSSAVAMRLGRLEKRISNMASIRDVSQPEQVADVGGQ